ncbi:MAG TPA: BACON domain-containing carbohydrate-binding protein [Thermoanaerobaculia bacterium]
MNRFLGVSLALAFLAVAPFAEGQRQRAVRSPAPPCSFSLSIGYANPISDTGLIGGHITVTPSAGCTSWNAFSPVDWIVFADETTTDVKITVQPNSSTNPRTAVVRVAGLDFSVTQLGRIEVPIIETGVVKNGTFATDLSNWGWQDRFPNGVGSTTWSSLDANGNPGSGSLRLRNTALAGPGMQLLQCVNVTPAAVYAFSFAYAMMPSGGLMQVSVFDLDTEDCTGPYVLRFTKQYFPNGTENWRRDTNSFRLGGAAKSALIVFASKTTPVNVPFDAYVDDVVLKLE